MRGRPAHHHLRLIFALFATPRIRSSLVGYLRAIVPRRLVDAADDPLLLFGVVTLELDRETHELHTTFVVTEQPAASERAWIGATEIAVDKPPSWTFVLLCTFRLGHHDRVHGDVDVRGRHPRPHALETRTGALEGVAAAREVLGLREVVHDAMIELAT